MMREYTKSYSSRLGREMELLVFGYGGMPVVAFPSSGGRFFEFEDNGMIATLADKIDSGSLQIFCVDSVNNESWYNRRISPRERILRHLQYEDYLLAELTPQIRLKNLSPYLTSLGCSFGGYHAVNIALRHPDVFSSAISLSGAFDLARFLDHYQDEDCYLNLPTYYLPNLSDSWYLDRFGRGNYILATGKDDLCLVQNQNLDRVMTEKGIPHQFHVWETQNSHDWPTWQRMAQEYL